MNAMKLGIHAYAWCSQWSNETLDLIDRVKNFGMDFIEIPLMCLETFEAVAVKQRLLSVGLEAVTSTVLLGDTDITSDNAEIRAKGVEYLKACVRATSGIGVKSFSGVIYSQHDNPAFKRQSEQTWQYSDCSWENSLSSASSCTGWMSFSCYSPANRKKPTIILIKWWKFTFRILRGISVR